MECTKSNLDKYLISPGMLGNCLIESNVRNKGKWYLEENWRKLVGAINIEEKEKKLYKINSCRTVRFDSRCHCCLLSNAHGILQGFSTTKGVKINPNTYRTFHRFEKYSNSNNNFNKDTSTYFFNPKKHCFYRIKRYPFLISPSYLKTLYEDKICYYI